MSVRTKPPGDSSLELCMAPEVTCTVAREY